MTEEEERVEYVGRVLGDVSNLKPLLHGDSDLAQMRGVYAKFQEAGAGWKVAWRREAAYRLAHLIMRENADDVSALKEVSELFEESAPAHRMLANVDRMAVLQRLQCLDEDPAHQEDICQCRERALEAIDESGGGVDDDGRLQQWPFNMIELATYFTDLSYTPLRGRGGEIVSEDDENATAQGWVIVGPERITSQRRISRRQAELELEEREKVAGAESCLFFVLGDGTNEWWCGSIRKKCPKEQLLLSLALVLTKDLTRAELHRKLDNAAGEDRQGETWLRKFLERGNEQLEEFLPGGESGPPYFLPDGNAGRDKALFLRPDLRVFGAVKRELLD